ncbi:MAG: AarF/UbiB family protein, partial [Bdellovibrionota bacterium]
MKTLRLLQDSQCLLRLTLVLSLGTLQARAAEQGPSDRDLTLHLQSNATLLKSSPAGSARRFDDALENLSRLSDAGLAHLAQDAKELSAPESLNALLMQQIANKVSQQRGIAIPAKGNIGQARQLFGDARGGGLRLEGRQLLDLLRNEIRDDAAKVEILAAFDASLSKQLAAFDKKVPELFGSDAFHLANGVQQVFIQRLSIEYFKRLSPEEKRLMLLDALESDPHAKTPQLGFDVLFRHAGPQYQKLLQIIARDEGLDPAFAKTLKKLESSVPESPFALIDVQLRESIPDVYPSKLRIVSETPLGSGTLAQTYSAVSIENGVESPVALRVLRPGVSERIRQETEIFEEITPLIENDPELQETPFANFGMIWKRITENVSEELHVELTASNQVLFQNVFKKRPYLKTASEGLTSDLRVPKVYFPELALKGVLVQEFVDGISFERLGRENPSAARAAAIDFATLWMREALYITGYHHSDPHQGNLRVAAAASARPQVYLLDYGMIGHLSETQRSDLILLGY